MEKGIGPTARALLQERVDAGYWYNEQDTARAKSVLSGESTPWHFLAARKNYEYENVELTIPLAIHPRAR